MESRRLFRGADLLAKVALAAASTLLTLGAAELVVRLAGIDLASDQHYRFHPVLGWTPDPACELFDHVNPQGFRHQIRPANPEGHRRLVILGDSFSFAGAYPFASTYAGRLQEWLGKDGGAEADGEAWDVVNLASGGYGTGQELLALREVGLAFEPDAVVLQIFPYNDLCNNNIRQAYTCSFLDYHRPYYVVEGDQLRLTYLHPWRARMRRGSRLFGIVELQLRWGFPDSWAGLSEGRPRWARIQLEEAQAIGLPLGGNLYTLAPEADQPEIIRYGWQVTERVVDELAAVLAERGTPLIGLVIPYVDTLDESWPRLRPEGHPPLVADHGTARAEAILRDAGARVISMRTRMRSADRAPQEYFYPQSGVNDKHVNDRGHFAIAGWIVEELDALGLSRRRAPAAGDTLCATDLYGLGRRIRWLPQTSFARSSSAKRLARLADIAGEAMESCRAGVADDLLVRLRSHLEGTEYLRADSEARADLLDEVDRRLAAIRSGRCLACSANHPPAADVD